ncbi:alpha/beta hydrolase [Neorhizobium sp. JUb45]|uniref:alpha/beta fold hydrolase n=1 Tax=unclassified Neorhizobium TaxID=2629175 RepID=UPI00104AD228|nr:alpha/beta hydrolase [Neorhizobium sp. JUb45]TCQ99924.1 pimeloyl-ACP methyl ester carboxylesterase [Neorhizobium sp. JUb45]
MRLKKFTGLVHALGVLVLMMFLASAANAAEKTYTVQSPDGVEIAVQESGNPEGKPIVFIHGLLGSRLNWAEQTSSEELQQYRMITYDLRGHGQSDKPDNAESYRDGRLWADDLAAVLKASDAKKPVVVGWSLGGVVISNYLAAYGDENLGGVVYVDGVIELNSALITPHRDVYAGLASDDLKTHLDAVRTFLALCFQTQPDAATFERLLSNAAMASWVMTKTVPSMTVAVAAGLPKAKVPVLLLYGGEDTLVMTGPSIARAKDLNPSIVAKIYPNSGHAPFLEEAARFNRDLSEFRKSIPYAK